MAEVKALITLDHLDPIKLFVDGSQYDEVLKLIETKADEALEGASLDTAAGRKIYASVAYKIARSKTLLDDLGKDLTIEQKRAIKKTDEARKRLREACEQLQADKRRPLTDWEAAEAARIEAIAAQAELERDWDDAIAENALIDREKAVRAREAEMAAFEAAKAQTEREAKLVREAEERARQRAEQDAAEQVRKANEERERARLEVALAEQRRIEAVKEAERQAALEAARKEQARLDAEAAVQAEAARRAADEAHQAQINRVALISFLEQGFDEALAKQAIRLIALGKIKHISINY